MTMNCKTCNRLIVDRRKFVLKIANLLFKLFVYLVKISSSSKYSCTVAISHWCAEYSATLLWLVSPQQLADKGFSYCCGRFADKIVSHGNVLSSQCVVHRMILVLTFYVSVFYIVFWITWHKIRRLFFLLIHRVRKNIPNIINCHLK